MSYGCQTPVARPAVIIHLELESRPRVYVYAPNEAQEIRLWDWISTREEILRLVQRAVELEHPQPAA